MRKLLTVMFVALLMVGCGEEAQKEVVEGEGEEKAAQTQAKDDPSVPAAIPCMACGKPVSRKTEKCLQCGHPTPDSVVAYKKVQELARIRAEEEAVEAKRRADEERKRKEELVRIQAEEKRKREKENARKVAQKKRLLAEEENKRIEEAAALVKRRSEAIVEMAGLEDSTGIDKFMEGVVAWPNFQKPYTGWVKGMHGNGDIYWLRQSKEGRWNGLSMAWYSNGQKKWEETFKDGKLITTVRWKRNGEKCPVTNVVNGQGVSVTYNDEGKELGRLPVRDGKEIFPD